MHNSIYERSYIWTAKKLRYENVIDHHSYIHNLSSCEMKFLKGFRPKRDSNPWLLWYRCSTLQTELSSQLEAGYFGCFLLHQRFRKFRSVLKWKGPFRFLLTWMFGITSGGGPLANFGRNIQTEIPRSIFDKPLGNSEKEFEMTRVIPIGWLGLIGKCHSIFLGDSHWSVTGRFGIRESTPRHLEALCWPFCALVESRNNGRLA